MAQRDRFPEGRAAGGGGDAAVAEFSVPAGCDGRPETEAVGDGKPAFLLALGHHAGCGVVARLRRAAIWRRAPASKKLRGGMLADPRAHEALDEFVSQWLRFDRLTTASKDRRKFPLYTRETASSMTEEARTVRLRPGLEQPQLHDAVHGRLWACESGTGAHLRRAGAGERVRPGSVSGRIRSARDLLGEGLFLALTAKPEESSPTARGLFVREQFLCQHVPDPPPGVNTNLPPVTEANPQTNRDRMTEHATNPTCATCHKLMDPVGFGLEKFDAVGARREQADAGIQAGREPAVRAGTRTVNLTIDTNGNCRGYSGFAFFLAGGTGRGSGEKRAMPGMHGEAVFPVYGRAHGDGRRIVPLIRQGDRGLSEFAVSVSGTDVSLTLLREFPVSRHSAERISPCRK